MRTLRSGDGILELAQSWQHNPGLLNLAQHSTDPSAVPVLSELWPQLISGSISEKLVKSV